MRREVEKRTSNFDSRVMKSKTSSALVICVVNSYYSLLEWEMSEASADSIFAKKKMPHCDHLCIIIIIMTFNTINIKLLNSLSVILIS